MNSEIEKLKRQRDALLEALRKVAEGDVRVIPNASLCDHDRYGYEQCESCYEDFARAAIAAVEEEK